MIALVQRVNSCSVSINNIIKSQINALGLLIFLCITRNDIAKDAEALFNKISTFRLFNDKRGKMNLSIRDIGGPIMIVSQFTLCGNVNNGRRPSFELAADPDKAEKLYNYFIDMFANNKFKVQSGVFGESMDVSLVNAGPVTFYFDTIKNGK